MIEIFNFDDYRAYLKAKVLEGKDSWGMWARLAKAAGCQATYLSQAMKGKVLLTADHIIGIANYLSLSDPEKDYLLLLLDLARAGTKPLKEYLQSKIKKIRAERDDIAKRFNQPKLEIGAKESLYYSAWFWSAIHIIVTIPEFKTSAAIANRLLIPIQLVDHALATLEFHGIVQRSGNKWNLLTSDIHIPKDSPMIGMHHSNWRQKAVNDALTPNTEGVHFTGVYSISKSDLQHLKEKILDLIEYSRKVVGPSKEEELVCMNCDFFKV